MWARKRIDISNSQLAQAIGSCLWPASKEASLQRIKHSFEATNLLVTLSVRSGFDLLLQSASQLYDWPAGSEVVFSGMTIADMPRIALNRNLSVVATNLNPTTMSPTVDDIAAKVTSNTRAVVVAHLLGSRCTLEEISKFAKERGLLLIEDCAQSFTGQKSDSSPLADVSMFSFGPIKTNTALGGAVLKIENPELLAQMESNHKTWPVRSRIAYLKRVIKYLFVVKPITTWVPAAIVKWVCKSAGKNHDSLASGMARGFPGSDFFKRIRHRPSEALLAVLARRLSQFDPQYLQDRGKRGKLLIRAISESNQELLVLGIGSQLPTHWVFAVAANNPQELTQVLWQAGFDATTFSSLRPVDPDNENLNQLLSHIVFLPVDFPMPERELIRMGNLVAKTAKPCFLKVPSSRLKIRNSVSRAHTELEV